MQDKHYRHKQHATNGAYCMLQCISHLPLCQSNSTSTFVHDDYLADDIIKQKIFLYSLSLPSEIIQKCTDISYAILFITYKLCNIV